MLESINLLDPFKTISLPAKYGSRIVTADFVDGCFLHPYSTYSAEDKWVPIFFAQVHESSPLLLIFSRLGTKLFTSWVLNPDGEYIKQVPLSNEELAAILILSSSYYGAYCKLVKYDIPLWADKYEFRNTVILILSGLSSLSDSSSQVSGYCIRHSKSLEEILSPYIFRPHNKGEVISALFLSEKVQELTRATGITLREIINFISIQAIPDIATCKSSWMNNLVEEFQADLLLEFLGLVTGKHLSVAAIGKDLVHISQKATLAAIGESNKGIRIIKAIYHTLSEDWRSCFIELKGSGFSSSIFGGILFGRFLLMRDTQALSFWGGISENDLCYALSNQLKGDYSPSEDNFASICSLSTSGNLGHILWNDLSGYDLVLEFLRAHGESVKCIDFSFPSGFRSSFAARSAAEVSALVLDIIANGYHVSRPRIDDISLVEKPYLIKSLALRRAVAESLISLAEKQELPDPCLGLLPKRLEHPDYCYIYLNIRVHSKSWTNLIDVFCKLAIFLNANASRLSRKPFFFIEAPSEAMDLCKLLLSTLNSSGICCCIFIDADLLGLAKIVSASNCAIVPIGSALVLPTWIFNIPTYAHSENCHLSQLEWWSHISYRQTSSAKISTIEPLSVHSDSADPYSNYTIDPDMGFTSICEWLLDYLK